MNIVDYIAIAAIILTVGAAVFYIIRAKRRGQRCIGCPDAKTCSGHCASCQSCPHKEEKNEE